MKKLFLTFLSLLILSYGFLSFEGLYNDIILDTDTQIYAVIYGNKVELDGSPSKRLRARLDAGYKLYENKSIQKVIVSGGIGIEGFDEAVIMKEYLLEKGILEDNIIVDSDGYTTSETSENAYNLLGKDITIVGISQWYHIARVKLSLKQAGFESIYGYAPKYFEVRDLYSIVRELPAYIKYILN